MNILAWSWFVVVELIMLAAEILGWVILVPFCLRRDWLLDAKSINDARPVDRWRWAPLNWVYGNPEDGVSGSTALVWSPAGAGLVPYMPDAPAWWRAYCWSAWRNSTDNLKYVFSWGRGPYLKTRWFQAGWKLENGRNVPVLSLAKG